MAGDAMGRGLRLAKTEGKFSHDLVLTNGGADGLADCALTMSVYYDAGSKVQVARYRAGLGPDEARTVSVPARGGSSGSTSAGP